MKRFVRLQALLLAVISIAFSEVKAQTVIPAEIPVSYDVSSSGAFTYTVPIEVPPGIKNLVPNLAVNYNSQGGNGPLGMGWSLSGLSAISRTNPTIYHDRKLSQVNFTSTDVFTLDGQRLVETSSGTYMTHVKNFAIIQAHGASGGGPGYFTVAYPNGMTYEYGNTASSQMKASGKSEVLMWAVSKIYDQYGNYVNFVYHNDQANGEYYITHILYGGNPSATIQAIDTVHFNYMQRPDSNKAWIAGSFMNDRKIISSIQSKLSNGVVANTYEFVYDFGDYTRLKEIKEKRGSNTYLPPIKINWADSGVTELKRTDLPNVDSSAYVMGDFNADGATDMVRASGTTIYDVNFFYSNKNNTFNHVPGIAQGMTYLPSSYYLTINTHNNKGTRLSLDMNGDGLDDVIFVEQQMEAQNLGTIRLHLYTAKEDGTFEDQGAIFYYSVNPSTSVAANYIYQTKFIPGDYDGDGIKDIVVLTPSDLTAYGEGQLFDAFIIGRRYSSGINLSLGNYGSLGAGWYAEIGKIQHEIYGTVSLDYDGDGKTELLTVGSNIPSEDAEIWQLSPTYDAQSGLVTAAGNLSVIYSGTYPSHRSRIKIPSGSTYPHEGRYEVKMWPGDFNGDGKEDLLTWHTMGGHGTAGTWRIAYSTGNLASGAAWEFASGALPLQNNELYNTGPWFPGYWTYQVADFNGDGKTDILQLHNNFTITAYPIQMTPPDTDFDIYYSLGANNFKKESGELADSFMADDDHHCIGDFNGDGQIDLLEDLWLYSAPKIVSFRKNDKRNIVASIEHAGKKLDIGIKPLAAATPDTLDEDHYGYHYWQIDDSTTIHTPREYPYIARQLPIKVVTTLNDNISMARSYYYQTLSFHLAGLGMQGFEKMKIRDHASDKLTINHFSLFPWWGYKEGYSCMPFLYQTTVTRLQNPSDVISNTRNNYFDKQADPSGKVRIIKKFNVIETNYLTGKYADYYENYDFSSWHFTDFCQPEWSFTDNSVQNGYLRDSTIFTYDVNAGFINKAKAVSVRKTSTYPSMASYSRTTNYGYNNKGLLAKEVTDPGTTNEAVTDYAYDPIFGNLVSTNLTAGATLPNVQNDCAWSPDGRFKIATIKYLGGNAFVDSFWYNNWGKVTKHQESNSLKTIYRYDSINRLVKTLFPDDVEEIINYDWAYNQPYGDNPNSIFNNYNVITPNHQAAQFVVSTYRNPGSWPEYTFIDFYGKTLRNAYPSFWGLHTIYEDFTYGADGRILESTDPYFKGNSPGNTTTYGYDAFGREIKRTPAYGASTSTKYAASTLPGFLETTVTNDATGQYKTTFSNAGGTYFIDDNGVAVETVYNSNGKPDYITINNDANLTTHFHYDDYGRMNKKTEPNKGDILYTYNAYSQLTREEYANGVKYDYKYDAFGRVVSKADQNGRWFKYEFYNTPNSPDEGQIREESTNYDSTGNVVTYQYEYNAVGKLDKKTETIDAGHSYITEYSYHPNGKLSLVEYDGTDHVSQLYTPAGDTWMVMINGIRIWQVNDENERGQVIDADYYDATGNTPLYKITRTYDELGFPEKRRVTKLGAVKIPLSVFGYKFDQETGNLLKRRDSIHNIVEDFGYDAQFDRLEMITSNIAGSNPQHIVYDKVGNIVQNNYVTSNSTFNWKYDKYALTTVPDDLGGTPELASVRQPFTQDVSYYPFNKLKTVAEGTNGIFFTYGPDEQRVKAVYDPAIPASKTRYYATNLEETIENGSTTKVIYITALGEPIAMLHDHNGNKQPYFLVTDHLGSITTILDNTGTGNNGIVEERSYDAWGRIRDPQTGQYFGPSQAPGWMTDRGYTGHEHLWLTNNYDHGIINMNGRLYDPLVGRMFSPDPVVPDNTSSQAYNKYSYVLNNPLKYTDPNGENPLAIAGFFIGGIVNTVTHLDDIMEGGSINWGKATGAFLVGGVAGAVAGFTGGLSLAANAGTSVATVALNAGMSGMVAFGVGEPIKAVGNNILFGDEMPTPKEYLVGMAMAGVTAASIGGIDARLRGLPWLAPREVPKLPVLYTYYSTISDGQKASEAYNGMKKLEEVVVTAPRVQQATTSVPQLLRPAPATITQKGLDHIVARHWATSGAKGAGKFIQGTTAKGLKEMVETTTTQGIFRANTLGRAGTIAEYNFRRVIGLTSGGSPALNLRVVIGSNNTVITAFPY